jgi:hypothetical protein
MYDLFLLAQSTFSIFSNRCVRLIIFTKLSDIQNRRPSLYFPPHCKEISIYVFPEKELRGLRPNFHIHVSVNDLYCTYIPTIGPPIFLQQNRQTHP